MQKLIKVSWPFLAIFIIISIFFYPVWLQNKVALPADITVGVYYPWLDYKYPGFPAGIPVQNPITTDVVSFTYPMQMLAIDMLKAGQMPLWNSLILGGTPLLANFQSAPFSPTNFVYWIFPKLDAWNLQIILQLVLSAIFTYLLLREFGRTKLASVAGGIFYSFAGFSMIWLEWNGHSLTAAFLPLLIFLVLKYLRTSDIRWGILFSISLALQIFSGYPQIILYEFSALILVLLIFDRQIFVQPKRLLPLGMFGLLGISLSAAQILPGIELLNLSQRDIEGVLNVSAFLPWQQIITFVAPDYFGNHATFNYWGSGDYTLNTGFSGVVVFILASLGVISFWKEKAVKFGFGLVIIALFIALPNPVTVFLKDSGLLGLQAASAHRALFLMNLGLGLLAAFGVDAIPAAYLRSMIRAFYAPLILLGGFGLATVAAITYFQFAGASLVEEFYRNLMVGVRNLILPSLLLFFTGVLLVLTLHLKRFQQVITIFVVLVAFFELFRFGWKFTPFIEKQLVFPKTPVIEFLENQPKPFRVSAEDVIPINMLMNYGIETTEGYDAVYPINYAKYLAALNSGRTDNSPMGRYGSVSNYESNLINLTNTKYILALKRDQKGSPDENGQLPEKFQGKSLKVVFEDKSVVVLENINALPRVKMFYGFEIAKGDNQLQKLLDSNFSYRDKLLLSEDPGIPIQSGTGSAMINQQPNGKVILVDTSSDGLLYIADSLYPGWKAFVDNKETKILRAYYNFMAIPVGSGKHRVELFYQPDSFNQGKIISLVSGLVLVFLSIIVSVKKIKNGT